MIVRSGQSIGRGKHAQPVPLECEDLEGDQEKGYEKLLARFRFFGRP